MPTPHEKFLLSGNAAEFGKLAATEAFDMACDYALLQLLSEMSPTVRNFDLPTDPYVAIDGNSQMIGARRVLAILKTIHEKPKEIQPLKRETPYHASSPTTSSPRHD